MNIFNTADLSLDLSLNNSELKTCISLYKKRCRFSCTLNKGKVCPVFVNEGWVTGGDPGPEPSQPQVAFSCAGAIQRLGCRSIRRICDYLRRILLLIIHLLLEVGYSAESTVAIRS